MIKTERERKLLKAFKESKIINSVHINIIAMSVMIMSLFFVFFYLSKSNYSVFMVTLIICLAEIIALVLVSFIINKYSNCVISKEDIKIEKKTFSSCDTETYRNNTLLRFKENLLKYSVLKGNKSDLDIIRSLINLCEKRSIRLRKQLLKIQTILYVLTILGFVGKLFFVEEVKAMNTNSHEFLKSIAIHECLLLVFLLFILLIILRYFYLLYVKVGNLPNIRYQQIQVKLYDLHDSLSDMYNSKQKNDSYTIGRISNRFYSDEKYK